MVLFFLKCLAYLTTDRYCTRPDWSHSTRAEVDAASAAGAENEGSLTPLSPSLLCPPSSFRLKKVNNASAAAAGGRGEGKKGWQAKAEKSRGVSAVVRSIRQARPQEEGGVEEKEVKKEKASWPYFFFLFFILSPVAPPPRYKKGAFSSSVGCSSLPSPSP